MKGGSMGDRGRARIAMLTNPDWTPFIEHTARHQWI
jgi:hypothetical protein